MSDNIAAFHKFMHRNVMDLSMFWYVRGIRDALPSVSVSKAIEQYIKNTGRKIAPDSAETAFFRMQKEYFSYLKQESKDE